MSNKSQLGSVIDELQGQRKDLEAQRAAINEKIVDMLAKQTTMSPDEIVQGLIKLKRKKTVKEETNSVSRIGTVNPDFYADAVSASKPRLRKGDSAANIGSKIYAVIQQDIEEQRTRKELSRNFEEGKWEEEERQHKALMDAIKKAQQPKIPKEAQVKPKKELPPRDEKGRFVKKQPEKVPEKAPAPVKEAPPSRAPAEKPAEPAPTAAKAPPPAPAAPTTAPVSVAPSIAKTAIKVAVGAAGVFASKEAFSRTMYPYAQKASEKLGGKVPPEAILGQWSTESGGGKSLSAPYNYAGIKAGKNDKKGDYVLTEERYTDAQIKRAQASGETLEKVLGPTDKIMKKGRQVTIDEWYGKGSFAQTESEGKHWVQVKSYFAKFDSFDEFVDRYVGFLSSDRYKKARESTSAAEFGLQVATAGYATGGAKEYSKSISGFASEFRAEPSSGSQLNGSSIENKDLKSGPKGTTVVVNNTQTNIVSGSSPQKQVITTPTPSEKPAILGN